MRFPAALLASAALCSTLATAADWPQWRGPGRDGHAPAGERIPAMLPAEPRVVWRVPVGDGFASPVVAGGRVFHFDHDAGQDVAHAFDAATGRELWRAPVFESHRDSFGVGPRCAPVADGEQVYFQSGRGELRCLASRDGAVRWRKNYVTDFGAEYTGERGKSVGATRHGWAGSPLVEGDLVFAQAGGSQGASVVALRKGTGETAWKSQNDPAAYAGATLAKIGGAAQLLVFSAEALFSLNPADGAALWRVPLKTKFGRHVTTPTVWRDLAMVASHQVGLKGIRVAREGAGWQATEAWTAPGGAMNFSSPVLVGDHLYGLGPARNVICVEAATGRIAWEQTGVITSSPDRAEAAFLVLGSNVLVLTDAGQLVLFAADPSGYQERGRAQACGNNWCNPAYSDGKLYLRDARELICLDLMSGGTP